MPKPVIATTFSGLFIKSDPWKKAHMRWFEEAAATLKDPKIKEWIAKPDYFKGVDEVTAQLFPDLSPEEQTQKARQLFFESVLKYIEDNPNVINTEVIDYFKSLKETYDLALITTNTKDAIDKILILANMTDMFDIIETSLPEEKDDKKIVFDRFVQKNGKPTLYIGGDKKASFEYCLFNEIPCVFANLEDDKEIENVESVHSVEELKQVIGKL